MNINSLLVGAVPVAKKSEWGTKASLQRETTSADDGHSIDTVWWLSVRGWEWEWLKSPLTQIKYLLVIAGEEKKIALLLFIFQLHRPPIPNRSLVAWNYCGSASGRIAWTILVQVVKLFAPLGNNNRIFLTASWPTLKWLNEARKMLKLLFQLQLWRPILFCFSCWEFGCTYVQLKMTWSVKSMQ